MPYYPAAHVDLLPEATTQPAIVPRLVILHTNAGGRSTNGYELRKWMARPDVGLECHFQVDSDGTVHQFMPVNVRADCHAAANPFAVSIETQDNGGGSVDSTPWTGEQLDAIVKLLRWLRVTYGIPMERSKTWDGSGVGAHRDFQQWSSSSHSCPGNSRFAQVPSLIVTASEPPPPPPTLELGAFMHVIDQDNGKFWLIAIDATGALYGRPIDEAPRGGDWDLFGRINDKVNGPLTPVPHDWLQALYDRQGKPNLPEGGLTDHVHALPGNPPTTGGVTP